MESTPVSRSLFRGQSTKGLGEGPDIPILHGEQYLLGSAPELIQNAEFLRRVRPWLTFDSDPADLHRLGDQLEGWSFAVVGPWQLVVRLRPAGIYDRRAAYFAHGRFWRSDELLPGQDPAAHLGRSEAFERSFRDNDPGERLPDQPFEMVRPEQVKANKEAAANLLAHLLEAITTRRPLVVVAAVEEFTAGGPLQALLSFAHAALPAKHKNGCRVRIYTRNPELFLARGAEETQLLAIPDWVAETARAARRDAIFVDSQGRPRQPISLDPLSRAYAAAVVERAVQIPAGLFLFSKRVADLPQLDSIDQTFQITYNLAFALDRPEERCGELLSKYLLRKAQNVAASDWGKLISLEDWKKFPAYAISEVVLTAAEDLNPGGIALRQHLEWVAAQLRLPLDEKLQGWWQPDQSEKIKRLFELVARVPPLVSPKLGADLVKHLAAERLAGLAEDPAIFSYLAGMTSEGRLAPGWCTELLKNCTTSNELIPIAQTLLSEVNHWNRWADAPSLLLDRLIDLGPDNLVPQLAPALRLAASRPNPSSLSFQLAFRLAELNARAGTPVTALADHLKKSWLKIESDADRRFFIAAAFSADWKLVGCEWLFSAQQLAAPWLKEHSGKILANNSARALASTRTLFEMLANLPHDDDATLELVFQTFDERCRQDPKPTIRGLIDSGWWWGWIQWLKPKGARARVLALDWLSSEAWLSTSKSKLMEAWEQVIGHVGNGSLSEQEIANFRRKNGQPAWPWIQGFEPNQLEALGGCAKDAGGLAALAEIAATESLFRDDAWEVVLKRSDLANAISAAALKWLGTGSHSHRLRVLSLAESSRLLERAGDRIEAALKARIAAVAAPITLRPMAAQTTGFEIRDALDALEAAGAGKPNLWLETEFLDKLADWFLYEFRLDCSFCMEIAKAIEKELPVDARSGLSGPNSELLEALANKGFVRIVEFLKPGHLDSVAREGLPAAIYEALSKGNIQAPCWAVLRQSLYHWIQAGRHGAHPLREVLQKLPVLLQNNSSLAKRVSASESLLAILRIAEYRILIEREESGRLPILELATILLGPGSRGTAACGIALSPAARSYWDLEWCRALLRELRIGCSAHDDIEVALAVLFHSIEFLETNRVEMFQEAYRLEFPERSELLNNGGKRVMGKIASFFFDREVNSGEAQAFSVSVVGAGEIEILVYSRVALSKAVCGAFDPPAKGGESISEGKYQNLVKELKGHISKAGGGIVLELKATSAGVTLINGLDSPPTRFVLVQPGLPFEFNYFKKDQTIAFPLGSRLLVPVDRGAEEALGSFLGHLRWLSRDVETLILDGLTRPSLERRVAHLEEKIKSGSGTGQSFISAALARIRSNKRWRWALASLATGVLLSLFWMLVWPLLTSKAGAVADFQAVLSQAPEGSDVKNIQHHFEGQLTQASMKEMHFALGTVKLLAIMNGSRLSPTELGPKGLGITKVLLKDLVDKKALTQGELNLLGYSTCNSFADRALNGQAGLESIPGANEHFERVDLPIICSEIKERVDLAEVGLHEMTKKLKDYLERAQS